MAEETGEETQIRFLESAIQAKALTFGDFTLKSGRKSPYFFNMGRFCTGTMLSELATAYAHVIAARAPAFDVVFGPAYKGIPLCALAAAKLAEIDPDRFGSVEYAYNRKEVKDHGEGGYIVGAQIRGRRVLLVDDVMTAGTAISEAVQLIKGAGGDVVGVIVCLDRGERTDDSNCSVSERVASQHGIAVLSVLTLDSLIGHLPGRVTSEQLDRLRAYRVRYSPNSSVSSD